MEYLQKENKYRLLNRMCPKKGEAGKCKHEEEGIIYAYANYINTAYHKDVEAAERQDGIRCNTCKSMQGATEFKVCSACKKVYYCSRDCQRKDWKGGHKQLCPSLK